MMIASTRDLALYTQWSGLGSFRVFAFFTIDDAVDVFLLLFDCEACVVGLASKLSWVNGQPIRWLAGFIFMASAKQQTTTTTHNNGS